MSSVDELLGQAHQRAADRRRLPESTYRLQLHAGFTFRDAARIVPYLRDLGITHCYVSPYLRARPGSTHGYDIIDHSSLNPEIGSTEDYEAWVKALHDNGLGQILDMVPNHMGVASNDNAWWNDVLENGPSSRFGTYFDVAWHSSPRPELQDKVLLPVLGEPYGDVLEAGQLRLMYEDGAFTISYYDRKFPVAPRAYDRILGHRLEELASALGAEAPPLLEYQSILTAVRNLPERTETEPAKVVERGREKEVIKRRLASLAAESEPVRAHIEQNVVLFNGTPGEPNSFNLLDDLLEHQSYRLAFWRVAPDEINYRRFFDINDLAALSMERLEVFEAAHALVLRLLAEGKIDGLRIDHPDGLYDPAQYFRRLQEHFILACARLAFASDPQFQGQSWEEMEGPLRERIASTRPVQGGAVYDRWELYVVAEKILGADEPLAASWAVHGTSGYDFVNQVNGLFVQTANANAFTRLYREWIDDDTRFVDMVYQKKMLILEVSLSSELHMLTHQLDRLAQKSRKSRDFTFNTLQRALAETIACFPVYRSYIADEGVHEGDRKVIEKAIRRAIQRNPLLSPRVFRFLRQMLLLEAPEGFSDEEREEQRRFAGKFQQVTAPVTAKGIEDTAFYVFNRLLSLNEVGGEPARFGISPEQLHRYNAERQQQWPYALSPLSTHDTKRSEDVRARINVLSEMPEEWKQALTRWSALNARHRSEIEEQPAPDPNEEYMLYQTLLGAWPLDEAAEEPGGFVKRIQAYMEKALHEAKVHTSWINPNAEYDRAVQDFVARILDQNDNRDFLEDFRRFQRRISHFGLFNSLAQTLLKITAPGVPDTYQGTELWDFSLVDPDNRRPVDYERRRQLLGELQPAAGGDLHALARSLVATRPDGRIKLFVTYRALHSRRDNPGLFSAGDYLPLEIKGAGADHVFAFARRQGERWAIVAVPRLLTALLPSGEGVPLGAEVWQDTALVLPAEAPRTLRNVFTGASVDGAEREGRRTLPVAEVFADFPVALLMSEV